MLPQFGYVAWEDYNEKKKKFLNYFILQFVKDKDPCSFLNEL